VSLENLKGEAISHTGGFLTLHGFSESVRESCGELLPLFLGRSWAAIHLAPLAALHPCTVIFGAWELSLPACTQARDLHSFVILGPQEDKECCACLILVDIKHKLLLTASTITQDTQTFRPRICVSLDCIYPILNTFIYKKKKLAIHVLEENSL
jgi:hypothetical protein